MYLRIHQVLTLQLVGSMKSTGRTEQSIFGNGLALDFAQQNPVHFNNLFNLDYMTSFALRHLGKLNSNPNDPTSIYIKYFLAEQEGDGIEKETIRQIVSELTLKSNDRDRYMAISTLVEARRLLEDSEAKISEIELLDRKMQAHLPNSLLAYGQFLLGVAYINVNQKDLANSKFEVSATQFAALDERHRELTSRLHLPSIDQAELFSARNEARCNNDLKSVGVISFELARRAKLREDLNSAINLAKAAELIFQWRFPDPRRVRIVQEFMRILNSSKGYELRGLEALLVNALIKAPQPKNKLIDLLYGRMTDASAVEYMRADSRLRSMIYRINKKNELQIGKFGDFYVLHHKSSQPAG